MKRIKNLKSWGIFENTAKEIEQYGFKVTVLHPDNMEYRYMCSPADTDMEFDSIDGAIEWIKRYKEVSA